MWPKANATDCDIIQTKWEREQGRNRHKYTFSYVIWKKKKKTENGQEVFFFVIHHYGKPVFITLGFVWTYLEYPWDFVRAFLAKQLMLQFF